MYIIIRITYLIIWEKQNPLGTCVEHFTTKGKKQVELFTDFEDRNSSIQYNTRSTCEA